MHVRAQAHAGVTKLLLRGQSPVGRVLRCAHLLVYTCIDDSAGAGGYGVVGTLGSRNRLRNQEGLRRPFEKARGPL